MKIKFNGIMEKRTKGCIPCGKARSEIGFTSFKTYILPSGARKTFRRGKVETVSKSDGEFLLQYQYNDHGVVRKAFEVVK